jgi:hypothetical protein
MVKHCDICDRAFNEESDITTCPSCIEKRDELMKLNRWCDPCKDDVEQCGHYTADHLDEEQGPARFDVIEEEWEEDWPRTNEPIWG